jgi:hypothetical protein
MIKDELSHLRWKDERELGFHEKTITVVREDKWAGIRSVDSFEVPSVWRILEVECEAKHEFNGE